MAACRTQGGQQPARRRRAADSVPVTHWAWPSSSPPATPRGREIVLVSSGAVAAGRMLLKDHSPEDTSNAARQAMAALGQTQTVALWQRLLDIRWRRCC